MCFAWPVRVLAVQRFRFQFFRLVSLMADRPKRPCEGVAWPTRCVVLRSVRADHGDVSCARSDSLAVRSSGLTSRQLREREWSVCLPVRLRASIGGRRVCFPGISTARNDWTVRGDFSVADLVGNLVFLVGDDGVLDADGERFRVSAVIVSRHRCVAPPSFDLRACADEQDFVNLVFGAQPVEFAGMPFEERELMDLSDVPTPVTPSSPDAERVR